MPKTRNQTKKSKEEQKANLSEDVESEGNNQDDHSTDGENWQHDDSLSNEPEGVEDSDDDSDKVNHDDSDKNESTLNKSGSSDHGSQDLIQSDTSNVTLGSPEGTRRRQTNETTEKRNDEKATGKSFNTMEKSYDRPPLKSKAEPSLFIQFLIILMGILAISILFTLFIQVGTEQHEETVLEKFTSRIEDLRSQSTQDKKLWRIVRSSMKEHIIDDNPSQPSVLMLLSTKESAESREELAKQIAEAYSIRCQNSDVIRVRGSEYAGMNHDEAKEKVDDVITSGFLANSCAVVISNFEKLPPATTKVFYQFCENDLAPFKRVAVIFTLEIEPGEWDPNGTLLTPGVPPEPRLWDSIADAFLYHSLESRDGTGIMKKDMIGGLLSRITPGVVWVK
uniref:torsin-1A-interacting protein 1-like n=1 Tax=Styela clava TaxID=7725 RepID=UPI001939FFF6|nr:torsin-1A-interacting protein 1-like [Styela clava]